MYQNRRALLTERVAHGHGATTALLIYYNGMSICRVMKKTTGWLVLSAWLCALALWTAQPSAAATHYISNNNFAVEFPKRWVAAEAEDNDTVLSLAADNASLSLSRLEEKPDPDLLNSRLQKELMSLRAKGYAVPSTPTQTANQRGARLIYAIYQTGEERFTAGFLIISGEAFALSAVNLREEELLTALQTLRRKGEPLEAPVPAEPPQKRVRHRAVTKPSLPKNPPVIAASSGPLSGEDIASLIGGAVATETAASAATPAVAASQPLLDAPAPPPEPKKPLFPRGPLPLYLFVTAAALWGVMAAIIAWRIPRLPPYKIEDSYADLPPEYNFPYSVRGKIASAKLLFLFSGRDGAIHQAEFNCLPEKLTALSAYALLAFEFGWSCLDMVGFDIPALLLALPGGTLFSALPEFAFLAALSVGLVLRNGDDRIMLIKDKTGKPLYKADGNTTAGSISFIQGNELGRFSRNSDSSWAFFNTDGSLSFEVAEKDGRRKILRKIFGGMGGLLDASYDLYVKGQPAGSVMPDPRHPMACVVVLSPNLYTAVNQDCLLSTLLFVKAMEQDCLCPWA